jgi:hypothetical protein
MAERIRYEVCPECGFANTEKRSACPACDNRLFSDTEEEHRRYVALVSSEHRKRSALWVCGWIFIALVILGPVVLLLTGKFGWAPGGGALIAALVIGWRLTDLQKRRQASGRFLTIHKNA